MKTGARDARGSPNDDDALMDLCARDDKNAFAELMRRHEKLVVGLARRYLGNPALAEEACQVTFLRLWDKRRDYESQSRFRAYLTRICFYACRELQRSRRRRRIAMERFRTAAWLPNTNQDPESTTLEQDKNRRIHHALQRLPRNYKEALILRFMNDMSYREMAEILDCSEVGLRKRVHHGLKRLEDRLQKERS